MTNKMIKKIFNKGDIVNIATLEQDTVLSAEFVGFDIDERPVVEYQKKLFPVSSDRVFSSHHHARLVSLGTGARVFFQPIDESEQISSGIMRSFEIDDRLNFQGEPERNLLVYFDDFFIDADCLLVSRFELKTQELNIVTPLSYLEHKTLKYYDKGAKQAIQGFVYFNSSLSLRIERILN